MTATVIFVAITATVSYSEVMITPAQIRAARALIGWKQTQLATAAGLSEMSVKNIERGVTDPRVSTMGAIQAALEQAGVEFINGTGVKLRPEGK